MLMMKMRTLNIDDDDYCKVEDNKDLGTSNNDEVSQEICDFQRL